MAFGDPPEKPKSILGYHRVLSPTAGVRVSPLCLGAMNFGNQWVDWMGDMDKKTAFEILDYFFDMGGNFIDTSNNYQDEQSETWIGEWLAERGVRDQMVIATKFTTGFKGGDRSIKHQINFTGNHSKSLHTSLAASLKKLQTDYIDLLYVHWWDFTTSIPELMQSLNHVVASGKVLYLGVSDTPAWVVSKANQYARDHGLRQFSVYQGRWSAADRDMEREILPMCQDEGMGIAPWGALGGGAFKTEEQRKSDEGRKVRRIPPEAEKVSVVLEKIAKEKNTIMTSVAMAYIMQKSPYIFPIVGGRKVEHLKGNIEALSLELSDDDMRQIDDAYGFQIGFPMNFLFEFTGNKYNTYDTPDKIGLLSLTSFMDSVQKPRPIKPREAF
ncbi:norsolorinic acid reductase [Rhizodiscina lignyota]|uniref:Norsolorinic acid reductase n=1 Tax=Rhizodiscina lignyota TaxID=1504668 RepID=A0A9P4MD55_9PEZI|nr:norsolorinic acid reductase [Rhizodiscina lignyota]